MDTTTTAAPTTVLATDTVLWCPCCDDNECPCQATDVTLVECRCCVRNACTCAAPLA